MNERMMAYTDGEDFVRQNCLRCRFYDLSECGRPCKESIPFLFNNQKWYPDYCPFFDQRPLTDDERRDLIRMFEELQSMDQDDASNQSKPI